jgi:outer membrane lipoprotein-sorting protein
MCAGVINKIVVFLILTAGTCWAGGCTAGSAAQAGQDAKPDAVDEILQRLNENTGALSSYQCRVEYLFSQPLFESKSLRKGLLYYQRQPQGSKLRIDFQTLKQDDEKDQKYIEQYIFDGIWLTHIDYQIKEIKKQQLAEPNEPADAFALAAEHFPIIGFTQAADLKKDFEIKLAEPNDIARLHLKVRPDSVYKDDYSSIDLRIDRKLNLPAQITAVSTEQDIYQITFIEPKVNQKIDKKVFEVKVPAGFGEPQIIPLDKKTR